MIRSSDDLPEPFDPMTPILAPGYMEMLLPLSTSRSGGWNRRRSRMVKMNCGAMGRRLGAPRRGRNLAAMCRNITTLRGLEPAATPVEIEAAARQYVRKISGVQTVSLATEDAFEKAVR